MKREIIKLVGGIPSIMPTGPSKQLSKNDHVTSWVWSKFHNPAREDNFKLSHWQRKEDVDKDYEYAHFNKKIDVVEYTPEEYERLIKDMDPYWSLEETNHLWDLCKRFDLRFIVIHDRYDLQYNRTVEELKDRYYSVARRVLEARKQFDHPILKSGYTYEHELKRRAYLERTINKTKEEAKLESDLIKQGEEIDNKLQKFQKVEKFQKNITEENRPLVSFEDYIENNANQNDSFVYIRSQKLKFPLPISEKLQKKVDLLLKELAIPEKLTPTSRVEQAYDTLRNNLIILTSLKKHTEKKEKELIQLREKSNEVQNKISLKISNIQHPMPQNIINFNTAGIIPDGSVGEKSVSSTSKDISKKNLNVNKTRKVIFIFFMIYKLIFIEKSK